MDCLRKLIFILVSCYALASLPLPGQADIYLPVLKSEVSHFWPDQTPPEFLPALIEQESGWKLKATLKTNREFGCGFGQFTKAYNADGSVRFDALAETRQLDKSLSKWNWSDCYNAQYQLRAVVLKVKQNNRFCSSIMADNRDTNACSAAVYNGGAGSITTRVHTCKLDEFCKPNYWFDNLEYKASQSTHKTQGYGESFAEINSKYPRRVEARMPKYEGH